MRIVILDGHTTNPGDNPWDALAALGELVVYDRTPPELVLERSRGAEVLLTNKTVLSRELIAQLNGLRGIGVLGTGFNVVDAAAARGRGIPVCNVPGYSTASVAQLTFALLLELCQRVGQHDASIRGGAWQAAGDFCFWETPQIEIAGLKLGLIGFGAIGARVGEIAHAFGMEVLAFRRTPGAAPAWGPFAWRSVEEITAEADVVSLHCPLTETNAGLVNAAFLNRMKPGAFMINTARGGLVNEADLAAALNAGRIAGAAVDVVSHEPVRDDNPLLHARNCIITPHYAWGTLAARRRLIQITAANVRGILAGSPVNVVN